MKGKWKENERLWKEKTGQQGNIKKTSEGQRKDKVKNMETWSCKQFHHTDKQTLINIWCTWLALQRLWSDTDWLTLTWHWLDIDNGLLLTVTLSLTLSTVMSQWVIDNSIYLKQIKGTLSIEPYQGTFFNPSLSHPKHGKTGYKWNNPASGSVTYVHLNII